jgi:hypothetical protein
MFIFDNDVRTISAAGRFCVPLSLIIFIFDGFTMARYFLLFGGHFRSASASEWVGKVSENVPSTL